MLNSKITFCCLLLAFVHIFGDNAADTIMSKKQMPIFCYINGTDWMKNAIQNSEFDANLCSYVLIRGTVNRKNWTIRLVNPNWEETLSNDMNKLKAANNNLKFVISIQKIKGQSSYFPLLAVKHHREFAANAKLFIRKYKLDGIHIDWWYPNHYSNVYYNGFDNEDEDDESFTFKPLNINYKEDNSNNIKSSNDVSPNLNLTSTVSEDELLKDVDLENLGKAYFLRLIEELKSQLSEDGKLITVSVGSANAYKLHEAYELDKLKRLVDYWFIIAFIYHPEFKNKIFQDAPMRTNIPFIGVAPTIDAAKTAMGPDYKKLVLAIPFYARLYKVRRVLNQNQNPFENGIRARLITKTTFTYNAVCSFVKEIKEKNTTWSYTYNTTAEAPYIQLFKRRVVVLYEDSQSVRAKTNLAINEDLGGIMPYVIDLDDYKGNCSSKKNVKFPLLKTVHETIHSPSSETWKTYQMLI